MRKVDRLGRLAACAAVGFFSVGLISVALAQTQEACISPGYAIPLFNGVLTSRATALVAQIEVQRQIGNTWTDQQQQREPLAVILFYNPTTGPLEDVAEAFKQKYREDLDVLRRFEHIWAEIYPLTDIIYAHSLLHGVLKDEILKAAENALRRAIDEVDVEPITSAFDSKLKGLVARNWKVFAIAHSQGNLYMSRVVASARSAYPNKQILAYHIAPPNKKLVGEHVLNEHDLIIAAVAASVGSTPDTNASFPQIIVGPLSQPRLHHDPFGHLLLDTYLNETETGPRVPNTIFSEAYPRLLNTLVEPDCTGIPLCVKEAWGCYWDGTRGFVGSQWTPIDLEPKRVSAPFDVDGAKVQWFTSGHPTQPTFCPREWYYCLPENAACHSWLKSITPSIPCSLPW